MSTHVDNAPLRERYRQLARNDGLTPTEVALRIGWMRSDRRSEPDGARVKTCLGLYGTRKHVTYTTAVLLADALNLDPHEVGV